MRSTVILLVGSLVACSGPIVSEKFALGDPKKEYRGTPHGLYCLPKEYFVLNVLQAKDRVYGVDITVDTTTVPDFDEVYRLGLDESWLSDDKITVEYAATAEAIQSSEKQSNGKTTSCLLSKISSSVTDMTPEIVRKLTTTVLRGTTGKADAVTTAGETKQELRFSTVFKLEPNVVELSKTERKINDDLKGSGLDLRVSLSMMKGSRNLAPASDYNASQLSWGVFGRLAQPYLISVKSVKSAPVANDGTKSRGGSTAKNCAPTPASKHPVNQDGKPKVPATRDCTPVPEAPIERLITEDIVYAHNGVRPYFLAIDRGAFVNRHTTISFADGYPTVISTNKGSELAGFMKIPLDIVGAIVKAPVAAIEADQELATERAALLQAQKDLIVKQRDALEKGEKPADKPAEPPGN